METQFDHAGIATADADSLATRYEELLDCERVHKTKFDGMRIIILSVGHGYFELLEPIEDGPIRSYLDSHGPGIHHLAVAVEDIEAALDRARALDVRCIDDKPRPGAWDHEVAFLHPDSTGGILLEFVQQ